MIVGCFAKDPSLRKADLACPHQNIYLNSKVAFRLCRKLIKRRLRNTPAEVHAYRTVIEEFFPSPINSGAGNGIEDYEQDRTTCITGTRLPRKDFFGWTKSGRTRPPNPVHLIVDNITLPISPKRSGHNQLLSWSHRSESHRPPTAILPRQPVRMRKVLWRFSSA